VETQGSTRDAPPWAEMPEQLLAESPVLVEQVRATLKADATEDQIWEAIASTDPVWREARLSLKVIEDEWQELHSPGKISLGPIGRALDSDEVNAASTRLATALADFTRINEELLERSDYARLLEHLLKQKRAADERLAPAPAVEEKMQKPRRRRGFLRNVFGRRVAKKRLMKRAKPSPETAPLSPGK